MRLHAPTRDVVVVRVGGRLDTPFVALLAERVGQQFTRAPHVVIDLGDVTFLGVAGVEVLRFLHRQAVAAGTQLHLAVEDDAVCRALHVAGLDQLLTISPTAAAAVARLAHHRVWTPAANRATPRATDGEQRRADGSARTGDQAASWQALADRLDNRTIARWRTSSGRPQLEPDPMPPVM